MKKWIYFLLTMIMGVGVCLGCGDEEQGKTPCEVHVDADKDAKCDVCGEISNGFYGGEEVDNQGEQTPSEGNEGETPATPVELPKPTLTFDGDVATWERVDGAALYEYKFGVDGEVVQTSATSVRVTEYCLFCVRAVGDGEFYSTGLWASYDYDALEKLQVTDVMLNANTGVFSWITNRWAVKYVYKIGENGDLHDCASTGSVTLSDGQTIYVQAIGDGVRFADSDWYSVKYTVKTESGETPFV